MKKFSPEELQETLEDLQDAFRYGTVLRAKGIVAAKEGEWIHFDYVPGESDVRTGRAGVIGRICVIGAELNEAEVSKAFKTE